MRVDFRGFEMSSGYAYLRYLHAVHENCTRVRFLGTVSAAGSRFSSMIFSNKLDDLRSPFGGRILEGLGVKCRERCAQPDDRPAPAVHSFHALPPKGLFLHFNMCSVVRIFIL